MFISLNWIREFVDIPLMNQPHLYDIVAGHVLDVKKHPDADKLNIAQVNLGYTTSTIVCGATNLEAGQTVAVARPGVALPGDFIIGKRTIRGVESSGMICSEDELGLKEERQEGIMVLDPKIKPGTRLSTLLNIPGYSPKQIGDLLTSHTAEVEGVKKQGDDYIIEIDNKSLTHRPDLWGHYGVAREIAAILDLKLKPYTPSKPKSSLSEKLEISCDDKSLCHFFNGIIVKNLVISESPEWMKQRLASVGINSINNIVDITNYVMLELGQPMHAYDRELIKSNHLHIKKARDKQEFISLKQDPYNLSENDIIITNHESDSSLMLAGVMGGANSEINQTTTEIIMEAACWPATTIRTSATKHNLRTDASQRFEKALDPKAAQIGLFRSLELLKEIQPDAKIVSNIAEFGSTTFDEIIIKLNFNRVNTYLGLELNKEHMLNLLERIEFEVVTLEDDHADIKVPSFRATKDVKIEVDLIEEIGRLHGYHNLPDKTPQVPMRSPEVNVSRRLKHELRDLLAGTGLTEILNYSFYSQKDFSNALLPEEGHIKLKNSLAETQTHMRLSLVPNLLKALHENLKQENNLALFEIGRSYKNTSNYFPVEEKKLVISLCQKKGDQKEMFFKLKGLVVAVLEYLKLDYQINKTPEPLAYSHPHQSASVISNNIHIGDLFSLHPLVKENFGLKKASVVMAELNLSALLNQRQAKIFQELPKFPDLEFDISTIVPETTPVSQIEDAIQQAEPNLIHKIAVFDIYRGENIPTDHKAIACKITLRDHKKTLSDDVMNQVLAKATKNLKGIGGQIRG